MLYFVLTVWVVAFAVSFLTTPAIRRAAPWLGLVDLPGHRKVHVTPTPMGGGIAVALGLAIPIVIAAFWPDADGSASSNEPNLVTNVVTHLLAVREAVFASSDVAWQMAGILVGAVILFFTGLADDRWNLSWKLRLGLQIAIAAGVVLCGVRATVFVTVPWVGFGVTVLWILVLTNAMNFLDNMDGLSAGIGVIAASMTVGILLVMVKEPFWPVAFLLLLLSGSLTGFLIWNKPPASIFMGDSGSNLIGFLLATLTICGTFYERSGSRHVILAPLCVLAVPLYDFVTVIWIRLRAGRSPFHGDKSHFSHRLVELGLRPSRAVLTIHLATLMTGLAGLLLYKVADWTGAWLLISLIFCVLAMISILETVGRRSLANQAAETSNGDADATTESVATSS